MSLEYGSVDEIGGMSLAIFQEMDKELSKKLLKDIDEAEGDIKKMLQKALDDARNSWRKLSYCISKGVIEHIKSNMEIEEIHTKGNVTTHIDLNTSTVSGHKHKVTKNVTASGVTFIQSDDGTGHVA